MPRAAHFKEYEQFTELVPGVFYEPGKAVYIVDNEGEVVSWNCDEWAEDPSAVTAALAAVAVAAKFGPEYVRENLRTKGVTLQQIINGTYAEMYEHEE